MMSQKLFLTFDQLTQDLFVVALAGFEAIRSVQDVGFDVRTKDDGSLVTEADLRSHEAAVRQAGETFPGLAVHSEEQCLDQWRSLEEVLIIDPLDGTTNFSRGLPFWSISTALIQGGKINAGVVIGADGRAFVGRRDSGSAMTQIGDCVPSEGKALHCARRPLGDSILSFGADQGRLDSRSLWWDWLASLRPPVCRRVRVTESAALELCWVASGLLDAYLHPTDHEWDIAAGALIAQEAGVRTLTPDLEHWGLLGPPGIIAVTPAAIDGLVSCLGSSSKKFDSQ